MNAKTPDPVPGFSYSRATRRPANLQAGWWKLRPKAVFFKLQPPLTEPTLEASRPLPDFSAAGITAVFEAGIATMPTEAGMDGYQN